MLHFLTIATLFFTLLVTLVGCSPPAEEQTELSASGANQIDATVRLNAWLDDEFAEYLDFSPLAKTRLGDKSDYGDLDDVSMVASNKILDWRRASVAV
jgi:hypothetical protein